MFFLYHTPAVSSLSLSGAEFKLIFHKIEINTPLGYKRRMITGLDHLSRIKHDYSVGIPYSRKTMSHNHYSAPFIEPGKILDYGTFVFSVKRIGEWSSKHGDHT